MWTLGAFVLILMKFWAVKEISDAFVVLVRQGENRIQGGLSGTDVSGTDLY
jgi:hypothetical protein